MKLYKISLRDSFQPDDLYDSEVYFESEEWWKWLHNYDKAIPEDLRTKWNNIYQDEELGLTLLESGSMTNDKAQIIVCVQEIAAKGFTLTEADTVMGEYKGLWY